MPPVQISERVRRQFSKSAGTITVTDAWRPHDGLDRPGENPAAGWTRINAPATPYALQDLAARGYTWVELRATGIRNSKSVILADLV